LADAEQAESLECRSANLAKDNLRFGANQALLEVLLEDKQQLQRGSRNERLQIAQAPMGARETSGLGEQELFAASGSDVSGSANRLPKSRDLCREIGTF
jgi:hypothetical protein